jgi:hypothetical protein
VGILDPQITYWFTLQQHQKRGRGAVLLAARLQSAVASTVTLVGLFVPPRHPTLGHNLSEYAQAHHVNPESEMRDSDTVEHFEGSHPGNGNIKGKESRPALPMNLRIVITGQTCQYVI